MSTTLTGGAISTVYKKLAFTKATSGSAGDLFYTQDADGVTDIALTTLTSPLTFSGLSTFSEGILLASGKFIKDSAGNEAIGVSTTGSAVNYLQVIPSATGNNVTLDVSGSDSNIGLTLDAQGTGIITCATDVFTEGDVIIGGNEIKTGSASSNTTAITLSSDDVTVVGDLTVTGTSSGTLTLGADADGTDRSLVFGHSTLKSIIGIDDDQDVFAINTDAAFEAANDLEIDASGNMAIKGDLTVTGNDIKSNSATVITLSANDATFADDVTVTGDLILSDNKDLKFTSTNGFEIYDGSTAYVTFASAGMTFSSAKTLTLAGATTISGAASFTGNTGPTAGTGITGASGEAYVSWRERFGNMIKTSIYIDINSLQSNGDQKVIGKDGGTVNCHLGQITTALNGTIVGGQMTCMETPATGDLDIDLCFDDASDGAEAADLTGETDLVVRNGDWAVGEIRAFGTLITADNYLYLRTGVNASDSTYSAGKFLIEIWGTA